MKTGYQGWSPASWLEPGLMAGALDMALEPLDMALEPLDMALETSYLGSGDLIFRL